MQPSLQTFPLLLGRAQREWCQQSTEATISMASQTELLLIFCCAKNYSTKLNITSYLFQLYNCNVLCNKDLHFGALTTIGTAVQLIFLSQNSRRQRQVKLDLSKRIYKAFWRSSKIQSSNTRKTR